MKQDVWYDKMQYFAMLIMAAIMPVSWWLGLWAAGLLALTSFVKLVIQRHVGNPALGRGLRWALYVILAYWAVNAISMFYSADLAMANGIMERKAVLLIFPPCFLLTDTSYLTPRHMRGIGYALLVSMITVIVYFIGRSVVGWMEGANMAQILTVEGNFDPRHHSYVALYATIAGVFAYYELYNYWEQLKALHRSFLIVALLLLVCYIVIVDSRAGILAMVLVAICCLLQQIVRYHRWWLALVAFLSLLVFFVGIPRVFPAHQNSITETVRGIMERGAKGDYRLTINRASVETFKEKPLFGYGVGDYYEIFAEKCKKEAEGWAATNTHNQYMESLLAAGIPCLLALLLLLTTPIFIAMRHHSRYAFPLAMMTGVVMFNLLFESMLERQMGLLFIGYLTSVMALILSVEENKFCRMRKS